MRTSNTGYLRWEDWSVRRWPSPPAVPHTPSCDGGQRLLPAFTASASSHTGLAALPTVTLVPPRRREEHGQILDNMPGLGDQLRWRRAARGGHRTDGLICGLSRGFHPEPHMTDASTRRRLRAMLPARPSAAA